MRFSEAELAAANRLFSAGVVRQLAMRGRSPLLSRLVREAGMTESLTVTDPLRVLFDAAFHVLRRHYRSDYVYRAALTHNVLLGVHSLRTATMLNEFRVGACKADVVVLNGTSTVYEIKSELDNLDRLGKQVEEYRSVFARVNVITAERHASRVLKGVPADVGVLVLTRRGRISTVQKAQENVRKLVPEKVFASLQLAESRRILELNGFEVPSVPNTELYAVQREMFLDLSPSAVHEALLAVLKETRSNQSLASLLDSVPSSLQPALLAARLRPAEHGRLSAALDTSIGTALAWA